MAKNRNSFTEDITLEEILSKIGEVDMTSYQRLMDDINTSRRRGSYPFSKKDFSKFGKNLKELKGDGLDDDTLAKIDNLGEKERKALINILYASQTVNTFKKLPSDIDLINKNNKLEEDLGKNAKENLLSVVKEFDYLKKIKLTDLKEEKVCNNLNNIKNIISDAHDIKPDQYTKFNNPFLSIVSYIGLKLRAEKENNEMHKEEVEKYKNVISSLEEVTQNLQEKLSPHIENFKLRIIKKSGNAQLEEIKKSSDFGKAVGNLSKSIEDVRDEIKNNKLQRNEIKKESFFEKIEKAKELGLIEKKKESFLEKIKRKLSSKKGVEGMSR